MSILSLTRSHRRVGTQAYFGAVVKFWRDLTRRRRFKRLMSLDDRMLDDIGLNRDEVLWAASLPLSDNASLLAHHKARIRRRQEATVHLKPL